jgi:DNA-binding MarR family transcriptional regulator
MSAGDALREFAEAGAQDLWYHVSTAARAANDDVFARLAARGWTDIRPAHMPVFAGLDPEGTHISTLASRAGQTRQGMSALVKDVELLGLVRTSPDPNDRRAVLVELTDLGANLCRDAAAISREITLEWRERLGAWNFDQLLETLRAIGSADSR